MERRHLRFCPPVRALAITLMLGQLMSCGSAKDDPQTEAQAACAANYTPGNGCIVGSIKSNGTMSLDGFTLAIQENNSEVQSDKDGNFRLALPPGDYHFQTKTGGSPLSAPSTVKVEAEKVSNIGPIDLSSKHVPDRQPISTNGSYVGNGGQAVFCRDNHDLVSSIVLLDVYEGQVTQNFQIDLGPDTLTYMEKVNYALSKLNLLNMETANVLRNLVTEFQNEAAFMHNVSLPIIDDTFRHPPLQNNCEIRQLVVQYKDSYPWESRYIVDGDLFDLMDANNQAATVLHEILYHRALDAGLDNSRSTRIFNRMILTNRLSSMSTQEYITFVDTISFPADILYHGLTIAPSSPVDYYPSGVIRSFDLKTDGESLVGGILRKFIEHTKIAFYETHEIMQGTLCFSAPSMPQEDCPNPGRREVPSRVDSANCETYLPWWSQSSVKFRIDGSFEEFTLDSDPHDPLLGTANDPYWYRPTQWKLRNFFKVCANGLQYYAKPDAPIKFQPNGVVASFFMSDFSYNYYPQPHFAIPGCFPALYPAEATTFYPSGNIQTTHARMTLSCSCPSGAQTFTPGSSLTLNDDGTLQCN